MKIYTRTGDDGTTGLFGGVRVSKDDPRVEAYGTVDELNSTLGLARASLGDTGAITLDEVLGELQELLFEVGADLATPRDGKAKALIPRLDAGAIARLEDLIDTHEAELPPLKTFILPGGVAPGAWLHFARTVSRRAERLVVKATETHDLGTVVPMWLNRLSDLLFVLARVANHRCGAEESPWMPRATDDQ